MKITERQLRKIINEEIKDSLKEEAPMTAGEKRAAKAEEASSLSMWATQAAGVDNADGIKKIVIAAIKATKAGKNPKGFAGAVKTALREILNDYENLMTASEEQPPM